jgi:SDR family mycofactocin-dependent oxidoreductase
MGLLDGKVAFVTGAARGMGRVHAVRLAREGASVIAIDAAKRIAPYIGYAPATEADLKETGRLLQEVGRPCVVEVADVRDLPGLSAVLSDAVATLGERLDVVVANAGVNGWGRFWELDEEEWLSVIDINLNGTWRTLKAAVPHMLSAGNGGSIITVSSVAGLKALPGQPHYTASKHGVTGLTRTAAIELGEYGIRVNSVHPWAVATEMGQDPLIEKTLTAHPNFLVSFGSALPQLAAAEPDDISNAVLWLASDLSRPVTGTQLTLDMGATTV